MVQQPPPPQLSLPCAAFQLPACSVCTHEPWSVKCYQLHGGSKQVNLGVGLTRSAAGCSGQPEVGFVQGALGLMPSRHVLPSTRNPPALCKIIFLFSPCLLPHCGLGCFLSHFFSAPLVVQMEKSLDLHMSSGLASQCGCVVVKPVMSYKIVEQGMCFGSRGTALSHGGKCQTPHPSLPSWLTG